MGTCDQLRRLPITPSPSTPGSPRSSSTTSGRRDATSSRAVLAVGSEVHLVAPRDQVHLERALDLRLVVDHEHPCHHQVAAMSSKVTVRPPPGVSSSVSSPPIARVNP